MRLFIQSQENTNDEIIYHFYYRAIKDYYYGGIVK